MSRWVSSTTAAQYAKAWIAEQDAMRNLGLTDDQRGLDHELTMLKKRLVQLEARYLEVEHVITRRVCDSQ